MSEHVAEIAVVGAGVIGSAIFNRLAGDGHSVTLIERGKVGAGTTYWSGGVVRCYDPCDTLLERGVTAWRFYSDFKKHTGCDVSIHRCGMLYIPNRANFSRARRAVRAHAHELPIEWLDQRELTRRFAGLFNSAPRGAVWEPDAGYLDPVGVTRAFVARGRASGGTLLEDTEISRLVRRDGCTVALAGSDTTVHADTVVLATGAQTPAFLEANSIPHDLYVKDIQADLRLPSEPIESHPAFIDDVYDLNGRGDVASGGVYLSRSTRRRHSSPAPSVPPDSRHSAHAAKVAARRFSWLARSTLCRSARSSECYAPDHTGRVRAVAGDRALLLATGLSGGGFKMAPWVAGETARLVHARQPGGLGGGR